MTERAEREREEDWGKYQKLVLNKLEDLKEANEKAEQLLKESNEKAEFRLRETTEKLEVRLRSIETELVLLKLKSSLWGGIAGVGAFAATWLIQFLAKRP